MHAQQGVTRALKEHRPLPRQLITPIFPGFSMWRVSMVIQITSPKLINYSFYRCRAILKLSSKSVHNLLSNGQIFDWAVSMVIQTTIKI